MTDMRVTERPCPLCGDPMNLIDRSQNADGSDEWWECTDRVDHRWEAGELVSDLTISGVAEPKDGGTTTITVPVANEMLGRWFKVEEIRIDVDEYGLGTITMRKSNAVEYP